MCFPIDEWPYDGSTCDTQRFTATVIRFDLAIIA